MTTPEKVKAYLRKIASKGGKKRSQHPLRRELGRKAVLDRWRSKIPTPKPPKEI